MMIEDEKYKIIDNLNKEIWSVFFNNTILDNISLEDRSNEYIIMLYNELYNIRYLNSLRFFLKFHPDLDIGKFKYHTKETLERKNEVSRRVGEMIIDEWFGKK